MSEPEYMICMNCETPTYSFEWSGDKLVSAVCETCGNDDLAEFITESEYEDMIS